MTKVKVNGGACGFKAEISVERSEGKMLRIGIQSDCESVMKMALLITELYSHSVLTGFLNNPVYAAASKTLRHTACPVPCAILKAMEVEGGMNVPCDVGICFIK